MAVPIYRSAAAVTEERLAALERRLGLQLPKDYRAFLLQHNGGMPRHNTYHFRDKDGRSREAWLGWIYSVGSEGKLDPEDLDLETAYAQRPSGLPAGLLPIAFTWFPGNSGMICVWADPGAEHGKVFLRPNIDPTRATVYPVAATFSAFLKSLTGDGTPQPWKEMIQDGDAAGLSQWLQEDKKWKPSVVTQGDMLHEAVSEAHWDVIEVLLKNGFSAEEMFENAIGGRRPKVALRLLERGGIPIAAIQGTLTKTWSSTFWSDLPLVRALLDAGADVDHVNSLDSTPLHYAGLAGSLDAVRLLLEHGANPTIINDDKETPAEAARRKGHEEVGRVLDEAAAGWRMQLPARQRDVAEPELHGVTFGKSGPALTLERLGELEEALGLDFPPEYRGLLLLHNGGVPKPAKFRLGLQKGRAEDSAEDEDHVDPLEENPDLGEKLRAMMQQQQELMIAGQMAAAEELSEQMNEIFHKLASRHGAVEDIAVIEWFYPVGPGVGKKWPRVSLQEIQENLKGTATPKRLLPIASVDVEGPMEGGTLHISCQGKDRGHIYFRPGYLEAHEETVYPVVESLSALFERLAERAKRKKSPRDLTEQAIRDGDADALQRALASGAKLNKRNRQGATLLDLAITEGQDDCVVMLIAHGASLDEAFQTALPFGAARLIRRLLDVGQGPSTAILKQALLAWGIHADPSLVRDLIARGADPKARGQEGTTPLHAATTAMNLESVRVLLQAGADPNAQDERGDTPLHAAAMRPGSLAVIRLLLEHGARAGIWNQQGQLALHHAARNGDLDLARLLIDAGEDLYAKHSRQPSAMGERQQGQLAGAMAHVLMDLQRMFKDHADPDLASPDLQQQHQRALEALAQSPQGAALEQFLKMTPEMAQASAQLFTQQGLSAAESAQLSPQGRAVLAELESYYQKKHPPDAKRRE